MSSATMTISALARAAGVTPDALRYYERLGLMPAPPRTRSGYRLYDRTAVEHVAFIRRAKALGLTLEDVREVLRLAEKGTAPCAHVRATLTRRLREVDARIAELVELRRTLATALARSRRRLLARSCVCDIIDSEEPAPRTTRRRADLPILTKRQEAP